MANWNIIYMRYDVISLLKENWLFCSTHGEEVAMPKDRTYQFLDNLEVKEISQIFEESES